jgi:hypothetical protein
MRLDVHFKTAAKKPLELNNLGQILNRSVVHSLALNSLTALSKLENSKG